MEYINVAKNVQVKERRMKESLQNKSNKRSNGKQKPMVGPNWRIDVRGLSLYVQLRDGVRQTCIR